MINKFYERSILIMFLFNLLASLNNFSFKLEFFRRYTFFHANDLASFFSIIFR